jgi:hypothetical protein
MRITRGAGETTELAQTEEAGYKLDGLILVIEGIGRANSGVAPVLQAFGVISYEDESNTYRMRAFNDGRFLKTHVKLLEEGQGMAWRSVLGEIKTKSVMRINENDEWTELHEIIIGSQPPKRLMQIGRPQSAGRNSYMNLVLHETATKDGDRDLKSDGTFGLRTVDVLVLTGLGNIQMVGEIGSRPKETAVTLLSRVEKCWKTGKRRTKNQYGREIGSFASPPLIDSPRKTPAPANRYLVTLTKAC